MFQREELEILCRADVREAVEQNIEREPTAIALDKSVPCASVVAGEVKRLQRARTKLPSYYAVRAVLPSLSYEQSSSEECALRKRLEGESVVDLTCGLGVDAYALSKRFRRVVTVERNEVLADVARENFARLGVENVEVVCDSAEHFVEHCEEHFDWCFVDPDRRGERGEKLVRLEHCSPNMLALLPAVKRIAERICIKSSPLFDVDEAFRLFGGCEVECVSLGGEMKEVNIYIGEGEEQTLSAVAIGQGEYSAKVAERHSGWSTPIEDLQHYRYLILPDASLQHARLVATALRPVADVWSNGGVALAEQMPTEVLGRVFEIEAIYPFDKRLKSVVQGRKMEIYRRDFPLSNSEICKRFRCSEGGKERWCFTRIGDNFVAIKF